MTREDILPVLEQMWGRTSGPASSDNNLTVSDRQLIEQFYLVVMRRHFTKTSCGECYLDALREMLIYLRKNDIMEQSNYTLKNGVILQMASDPNVYTNLTLTDKVAEKYLKDNPNRIGFFSHYPDNWKQRILKTEAKPKGEVKPKVDAKPKMPRAPKANKIVAEKVEDKDANINPEN